MGVKARKETEKTDLRDQAAYGLAEAARYLKLPAPTLRSWVAGRAYPKAKGVGHFRPLIHPPQKQPPVLSFWNLIEAHVLRSLRTEHGVSLRAVREAVDYAEKAEKIERLFEIWINQHFWKPHTVGPQSLEDRKGNDFLQV